MLNAFRHQRFNTGRAGTGGSDVTSAQRLSASEIQHGVTSTMVSPPVAGAQRLSASEIQHTGLNLIRPSKHRRAQRLSASEIQHYNVKHKVKQE